MSLTPLSACLPAFEANLRRIAAEAAPSTPSPPWPERIEPAHFRPRLVDVSEPWGVARCSALELALTCRAEGCCDGQIYERQGVYTIPRPCVCDRWRKAAQAVTAAHIPAEFGCVTPLTPGDGGSFRWGWLTNAEQLRAEVERHYSRGDGVLFVGPPGGGKSHLATALLLRRLTGGESGRWWSWRAYCEAVDKAHFGRVGQLRPDDIAAHALAGRWLLLDDLWVNTGIGRDDEADMRQQVARLHDLLDRARQTGTRIIATSNIPLSAMQAHAKDHVLSRMTAAMAEVKVVGRDRRRDG